jgi:hypothetical protein
MKITKQQLKQIIKEEVKILINETDDGHEEQELEGLPGQVMALAAAINAAGDTPRDEREFEVLRGAYQNLLRAIYESGLRVSSLIPWDAE